MKYIIQIIGVVAFVFFVSGIYSKKKKNVLTCQLIANLLYGIQYILLNVITAGILNFVTVLRCFTYYKYEEKRKKIPINIFFTFAFIIIIISITTINGWLSVIPMIINIVYSYATWQNSRKTLVACFLVCGIIWFFYNLYVGAYAMVLGNIVEVSSSIIVLKSMKK